MHEEHDEEECEVTEYRNFWDLKWNDICKHLAPNSEVAVVVGVYTEQGLKVKTYCANTTYRPPGWKGNDQFAGDMFDLSLTHRISDVLLERNYLPGIWGVKLKLYESTDGRTNIDAKSIGEIVERFLTERDSEETT